MASTVVSGNPLTGRVPERMNDCMLCSWPYYGHCCKVSMQAKSMNRNIMVNPGASCRGCFLLHPVSPHITTRSLCLCHCPFFSDAKHRTVKKLENSLDAGIPVLAKKETDSYYYQGTIVKGTEEGEERTFLIQFAVGEDTASGQKTARSDILECVKGMRHSILPGDKVMAPWEPEKRRYGPGTVLEGMETRDPLREKEDEEITVSFWNGKKAKVPLGVALWISPAQWERIVETIHMPYTSRKQLKGQFHRPSHYSCSCWPRPTCALGLLSSPCSLTCPCYNCFHHTCSLLRQMQSISSCCFCPKYIGCMLQPSLAELTSGDFQKELSSKLPTQFLPVEGPPKVEHAADLSSSSSCSSGSPWDRGESVTTNKMVDHAVNTDSSPVENLKLKKIRRPDWKYWKRSHTTSPDYKSQGANFVRSSCRKERRDNKAILSTDGSPTTQYNHSAIFETIEWYPQKQLSVKDVLSHRDIKSSWGG